MVTIFSCLSEEKPRPRAKLIYFSTCPRHLTKSLTTFSSFHCLLLVSQDHYLNGSRAISPTVPKRLCLMATLQHHSRPFWSPLCYLLSTPTRWLNFTIALGLPSFSMQMTFYCTDLSVQAMTPHPSSKMWI